MHYQFFGTCKTDKYIVHYGYLPLLVLCLQVSNVAVLLFSDDKK